MIASPVKLHHIEITAFSNLFQLTEWLWHRNVTKNSILCCEFNFKVYAGTGITCIYFNRSSGRILYWMRILFRGKVREMVWNKAVHKQRKVLHAMCKCAYIGCRRFEPSFYWDPSTPPPPVKSFFPPNPPLLKFSLQYHPNETQKHRINTNTG